MAPSVVTMSGESRNESAVQNGISPSGAGDGYRAFDHVLWYVGNAKQAASYYVSRMGFKHVAYVFSPAVVLADIVERLRDWGSSLRYPRCAEWQRSICPTITTSQHTHVDRHLVRGGGTSRRSSFAP